jgi:hypothetical protein
MALGNQNITSITDLNLKINQWKVSRKSFTFNENGIFELKSANTSKLFFDDNEYVLKCQMEIRSK